MTAGILKLMILTWLAPPASAQPPLRDLNGSNAVIGADWSAKAAGRKFDPVRDGEPSLPRVMEGAAIVFQVPGDASGHKQRIEYKIAKASDPDGLHFDNARVARFSFRLPSPVAPFLGSAILFQCWQGYPFGPPVSLKIVAGAQAPFRLKLAVRNMATGPDSAIPDVEIWSAAMIRPDVWYDVVVHVEPRPAGNGHLSLSIDGAEKVSWQGAIGYDPRRVPGAYDGLDIKNGIYQPGVNNGHTVYFNDIVLGADVRK